MENTQINYLRENEDKLRKLLLYLDSNNDYYHNIFINRNLDLEGDIINVFQCMPIISKKDINSNFNKYISRTNEKLIQQLTSGTNGEPLKCLKTSSERTIAALEQWKERRKWDDMVNNRNFINIVGNQNKNFIGDFTNFDKYNMKTCFEHLVNLSPRWLWTSISVIEKYARAIERGDLNYKNKTIKFIELAGEYVDKSRREYIEDVFNCKTINHYGTRECWCIAYECPEGELHVLNNLIYVENINNCQGIYKDNEVGEIVITSLYNKAMPLIRYNIEDFVQVSSKSCKCGKTSQVIKSLNGRKGDIIKGTNGLMGDIFFKRIIHSLILKGFDCIESFRIEQVEIKYFIFYIVKKKNYSNIISNLIKDEVSKQLGMDTIVEFRFVEKILLSANGKTKIFRCIVSSI